MGNKYNVTGALIRRETFGHRRESHMKTEAEIRMMYL